LASIFEKVFCVGLFFKFTFFSYRVYFWDKES